MKKNKVYDILKKKLKNKDVKVLVENFFSLSALQLFGMILPLITLPYVLRVLEFEKYGLILLATSLVAYFQSLTDYSFTITATRDVALFKSSPDKLNIVYSKVITIKIFFLIISLLVINFIAFIYPPFQEEQLLFFFSSLTLVGHALFPTWYFRGIEKMKYITIINLGVRIIIACGIFIFIKEKDDYWKYPLIDSTGLLVAGAIGQFTLIRFYKRKFVFLKPRYILSTIKENFPIFVNQFTPTLYNNTSSFLLGIIGSPAALGLYGAIRRILLLQMKLINILSVTFFPFLTRNKGAFSQSAKIMMLCSFTAILIPLIFHELIFWVLNIKDSNAFWLLLIMNVGAIFLTLYYIFGTNYFIARRKDKIVMRNTLLASILGFVLAYPLISNYGAYGAALNVAVAHTIMGGGLLYQYLRRS